VPPVAPPPPVPLADLALATHRAFFDAWRAHDADALAKLYAPEAGVYIGLGVVEAHGPDAAATLAKTLFEAFPDARVQWGTLLQSGSEVAVELGFTGTHAGPLATMTATKKVVGTRALLLERFAPNGLIEAQRLYFDADALAADLGMRTGKAHAWDGLPTSQTTVLDHAVVSADDDAAMRGLLASLARGTFGDARALGQATSSWYDATKGRTTTGKGAVPAWVAFLERTFKGGGKQLIDVWSTGEWVVLEWSGTLGVAPDTNGAHAAELVLFDGGHIAEVRTYRSAPPRAEAHRAKPPSSAP
jgi:predicted ester cyclase